MIERLRIDHHARWLAPLVHGALEPAHAAMGRRQLLGIADRAVTHSPAMPRLDRPDGAR